MEKDEIGSRVFSELKAYCVELLGFLQNPPKGGNSAAPTTLAQLRGFLHSSSSHALQPFLDYALFPLLLLLDASVDCRASPKVDSEKKHVIASALSKPGRISDSVAEGVVCCLEELLQKCYLGSTDQMVLVLKKLTYGALLGPSEASEEFREGVIRCFKAVLLNLHPCPVNSCSCKQALGLPALLADKDLQTANLWPSKDDKESEECVLSFLQSEIASAAVGHWISLLIKAADTEVSRGLRGSAKLRLEALSTFRVLVAKVGTADALVFFLPGVVSQLAKVLHISRTMISGAAGNADAIDHAIRGLAEFLMVVLHDNANTAALDLPVNIITASNPNNEYSAQSFLEELRNLPINAEGQFTVENTSGEVGKSVITKADFKEKKISDVSNVKGAFHVNRSKDWLKKTSGQVDKLLSAIFPNVCVHPVKRVRHGLLAAIQGLITKCNCTMKESKFMLLECLCVLVSDDSEEISADAQKFFDYLFSSSAKHGFEQDLAEIFRRLIEKLPKVMLGNEESLVLSHAQQLLAVIYYSGPQLVVDHLLRSPITAARFLDVFSLCLSQNFEFVGSLDKLYLEKPFSDGYLQSVSELKSGLQLSTDIRKSAASKLLKFHAKDIRYSLEKMQKVYELPRMPPWFAHVGSQKLYQTLAGILRLVGLSLMADARSEGSLSVITDIPLGYIRKLVAEIRMKECSNEGWQSWYDRIGYGQLLRQASTAACILNEIIFGISDQAVDTFSSMFQKSRKEFGHSVLIESSWKIYRKKDAMIQLIDCVGSILHEYLSTEVWNLPIEQPPTSLQPYDGTEILTTHFLRDTAMLHQVIIDGLGIFNLCLGKDFDSNGFLQSSLYLLLANLICSNFQVRSAADAVLCVFSTTSGYPTVGHLVVENTDYIIDSISRQLRHLDLNPQVPNLLSAMLSYIGVAHKILPMLEEPMHSVSIELEILGRRQHPDLIIPFLKAVAEIARASNHEACSLFIGIESQFRHVKSRLSDLEKEFEANSLHGINVVPMDSVYVDMHMEQLEEIMFKLNDSRRYRHIVASIVTSCLTAATPLLASVNPSACLVALDVVEVGIPTLAKVEATYKLEKETKEALVELIKSHSSRHLLDALDTVDEGTNENRLLPAMNKIWPFLVVCVQSKNPVAVRRCLGVVSHVVQICGGDFFSRRFHTDGPHFWKLLSTSPFQKNPISKNEGHLMLPYRSTFCSSDDPVAEVSSLKVQAAVLNMIADISQSKRSASAVEVVLKKVSGLVVGIACSGVSGLQDAAFNALLGLASLDSDLIWLLLADVYYCSLKMKGLPSRPTSDYPEISQILPPPQRQDGYLYVQYGGQSFSFGVDFSSVESVFKKFDSVIFTSQMYS